MRGDTRVYSIGYRVHIRLQVQGYDATLGYAQDLGKLATEDAMIVKCLKELGAIPFVRTNVPQSLLSFTCSNPIYGLTTNPWNPERTCGGSSGGEAALLSLGGAPFGIGGDVGGSLRIPAHFCGISAIKVFPLSYHCLFWKNPTPVNMTFFRQNMHNGN